MAADSLHRRIEQAMRKGEDITTAKFTRGCTDFMCKIGPTKEFQCTGNTLKKKVNLRMPQCMDSPRGTSLLRP